MPTSSVPGRPPRSACFGLGFPRESYGVGNWPESQRLLPHVLAVAQHGQRLEVEAEVWPWLLSQAACICRAVASTGKR